MPFGDSELDAMLFFGREREREIIAANLAASRLTILYGESGVGKTSVLRAGVAYHLRQQARQNLADRQAPEFAVVVFDSWHGDPVSSLVTASAEQAGELVGAVPEPPTPDGSLADTLATWSVLAGDLYVILDQIEEYFVYHPNEEADGSFGEQLAEAIARTDLRVNFLVSLREDALAKLDRFKGRIPNLFANYLRLDHLGRDAARMAILEPLKQYNRLSGDGKTVTIEPELVEAILDEISAGGLELGDVAPGGLAGSTAERIETPFLQLVLQRLWEESDGGGSSRQLRLETFRSLGGAKQIVEEHLGRALDALERTEKDLAAGVFNHLVTPTGGKIAHTVTDLAEYARVPEEQLAPVLSTLAGERILRPVAAADEPEGSRFEIFHDVLATPVLSWRTAYEAQRKLDEERSGAARRHRRLLAVAIASLVGLAIAAGLAVFALTQRSEAQSQARLAQSRELAASALAQLSTDAELSVLLSLEAARTKATPEAEDALRKSLIAAKGRRVLDHGGTPVIGAGFLGERVMTITQDGALRHFDDSSTETSRSAAGTQRALAAALDASRGIVALASADGTVRVIDTESGGEISTIRQSAEVAALSFGAGGEMLVVAGKDGTAQVWRASTGTLVTEVRVDAALAGAAISPAGDLLATASRDGTTRIWRIENGEPVDQLRDHKGVVADVVFSDDGKYVATVGNDSLARVFETASGDLVANLFGHTNALTTAAFSPDGRWVATASRDGSARIWEIETGRPAATLLGHRDAVVSVAFDSTSASLVTGSSDGTARVWEVPVDFTLAELARSTEPIRSVSFTPDGTGVLFAGDDGRIRIVEGDTGEEVRTIEQGTPVSSAALDGRGTLLLAATAMDAYLWSVDDGTEVGRLDHGAVVTGVALSQDGSRAITAGLDGVARIWETETGAMQLQLRAENPLTAVAFSPDGNVIATAGRNGTAAVWDARSGTLTHELRGHRDDVTGVAFSPDGRFVVTSSRDHDARVWEVASGRLVHLLRRHFGAVAAAAFSPDGRWIVTAGPTTAGLWEAESGRFFTYLRGHETLLTSAAFAPDSRWIATAGEDGRVRSFHCDLCGSIKELVELGEQRLTAVRRELTPAERAEFVEG